MANISVIVLAIPTQHLRDGLQTLAPYFSKDMLVICAAKGIEVTTLKLPLEMIADELGPDSSQKAVILSGPSFAVEVINRQPTAVAVASRDKDRSSWAQESFPRSTFSYIYDR